MGLGFLLRFPSKGLGFRVSENSLVLALGFLTRFLWGFHGDFRVPSWGSLKGLGFYVNLGSKGPGLYSCRLHGGSWASVLGFLGHIRAGGFGLKL